MGLGRDWVLRGFDAARLIVFGQFCENIVRAEIVSTHAHAEIRFLVLTQFFCVRVSGVAGLFEDVVSGNEVFEFFGRHRAVKLTTVHDRILDKVFIFAVDG